MGQVLERQGKDEEAEKLFEKALGIFQKGLGPEHDWTKVAAEEMMKVQKKRLSASNNNS